jgi:uncharacterized damage-inducible protein DinB
MDFQGYFKTLALYNRWANQRIYTAVAALPPDIYMADRGMFFRSVHGTLNHILVADRIWLFRITGEGNKPQTLDEILYDDFEALKAARIAEDERILKVVSHMPAAQFDQPLAYANMKGVALEDPCVMVFGHLFNHQTHHRGQIHSALSQAGYEPPALDIIYFQREEISRAAFVFHAGKLGA